MATYTVLDGGATAGSRNDHYRRWVRQQQQHEQSDGLILGLCAGIAGVWVTKCISKRVTEPVFFTIVEQSAATAPDARTDITSSRPACWLLSAQQRRHLLRTWRILSEGRPWSIGDSW